MLDNYLSVPVTSTLDPQDAVYFAQDGENTSPIMVDRFWSVMVDKNRNPRKDKKGELLYESGIHPNDLPGKVFLQPDKGTNLPIHMTVGERDDFDTKLENNEVQKIRFKIRFTRDDQEDIMSYNKIVDFMTRETNEENGEYWKFQKTIGHEKANHHQMNYSSSSYNLRIAWENGEISEVPLKLFAHDATVECAIYAKENDLLDKPGWKRFQRTVKRSVKLVIRMINQVWLR